MKHEEKAEPTPLQGDAATSDFEQLKNVLLRIERGFNKWVEKYFSIEAEEMTSVLGKHYDDPSAYSMPPELESLFLHLHHLKPLYEEHKIDLEGELLAILRKEFEYVDDIDLLMLDYLSEQTYWTFEIKHVRCHACGEGVPIKLNLVAQERPSYKELFAIEEPQKS